MAVEVLSWLEVTQMTRILDMNSLTQVKLTSIQSFLTKFLSLLEGCLDLISSPHPENSKSIQQNIILFFFQALADGISVVTKEQLSSHLIKVCQILMLLLQLAATLNLTKKEMNQQIGKRANLFGFVDPTNSRNFLNMLQTSE